ncbi:ankyrin repeat domain-containing protein [Chryseobacterium foetidum]|uniref:ankyrin repeat domain-containing protein n=1 Tax=Chryseobacterium foetidum TaxID=2951057 RepID=UPI0021C8521A|nr:ankyrin repeat domain-containing protein [Chryseobacterium foetidum]
MKNIVFTLFAVAVFFVSNLAHAQQLTDNQKQIFNNDNVEEFIKVFSSDYNKCITVKDESFTPLAYSTRHHKTKIFNFLVKNGANVSLACNGNTPLMEAVKFNAPDLAKTLLEKGADKSIKDSRGKTAKDYAAEYKRTEIFDLLK